MRTLILGSGGREHALAWKIAQSPLLEKLWIAPGNPGTAALSENVDLAPDDLEGVCAFARRERVDLVVIGPEAPLVAGMVDALEDQGTPAFGPRRAAAELEGSKAWCKEVLQRHRVPTAGYRTFQELNPAISYLEGLSTFPVVVKASGLAAGKGVVVCSDAAGARAVARDMLEGGRHGDAGRIIVVEEFLEGPEASAFCLTDGRTLLPLDLCQDHKSLGEGGAGPNTGGMGAVCPNPDVGERTRDVIEKQVLLNTLHGMNREGRPFRGVLFAGLMLTTAGPKVLEFNVRFGDPECQALLPRLRSDLLPYLAACARGKLEEMEAPEWDARPACTVVLASEGYPGAHRKGLPISGVEEAGAHADVEVFHAGTARDGDALVTAGGRVLAVTALGEDFGAARERAYAAAGEIRFEGRVMRGDIGRRAARAGEGALR